MAYRSFTVRYTCIKKGVTQARVSVVRIPEGSYIIRNGEDHITNEITKILTDWGFEDITIASIILGEYL